MKVIGFVLVVLHAITESVALCGIAGFIATCGGGFGIMFTTESGLIIAGFCLGCWFISLIISEIHKKLLGESLRFDLFDS